MSEKEKIEEIIPFPYYVNQPRLLDLFSLLNDGYSEYEEISVSNEENIKTGKQANMDVSGGFRLFSLGGSAGFSREKGVDSSTASTTKRVQTVPTMLKMAINGMKERKRLITGELGQSEDIKAGKFVLTPVKLKINSLRSLMAETEELLKLLNNIEKFNSGQTGNKKAAKDSPLGQVRQMQGIVKELVGAEEVIFDADNYALIGNITDENLYQATRQDLIGTDLQCLAQVKRVLTGNVPLLRNTIFAKLKTEEPKEDLINAFKQLINDGGYQFEADIVSEIKGKPVYEVELVALYLEP